MELDVVAVRDGTNVQRCCNWQGTLVFFGRFRLASCRLRLLRELLNKSFLLSSSALSSLWSVIMLVFFVTFATFLVSFGLFVVLLFLVLDLLDWCG